MMVPESAVMPAITEVRFAQNPRAYAWRTDTGQFMVSSLSPPKAIRNPTTPTLMQNAIFECLHVYGIAAGISVAIAVTIKLIVLALTRAGAE